MASTIHHWRQAGIGRSSLSLVTAPKPIPYAGEVLVRVTAASLNYRDKLVLEGGVGLAPQEPIIPGTDFAGVVEDVGDGVALFRRGDRVVSTIMADWTDGTVPVSSLPSSRLTAAQLHRALFPSTSSARLQRWRGHQIASMTPKRRPCRSPL